jgi:hypothetical protein
MDQKPNTCEPQKPRRRWFQFRLRTLLIAVVLLGSACGYVAHEASIVRARQKWFGSHDQPLTIIHWNPAHPERGPSALRRWLGDKEYPTIQTEPKDVDEAERLFPKADLLLPPEPQ